MDPNALLEMIRELSEKIIHEGGGNRYEAEGLADRVAELDKWLSRGGFPPDAWTPKPRAVPPVTDETLRALLAPVGTFTPPDPAMAAQGRAGADDYAGPTFREDEE